MKEIWKDLSGYEGYYQVSNKGNVRSLDRIVSNNNKINGKIISHWISKEGYRRVNLYMGSKYRTFFIHRLVASHFIPNPLNKTYIDHIDTNPNNNCVSNLRWCTEKENSNNTLTIKHKKDASKASSWKANKTKIERGRKTAPKKVCQYDVNGRFMKEFESSTLASKETGISQSDISSCCLGKKRVSGGFFWAYSGKKPIIRRAYSSKCHKIKMISPDGKLIKIFSSLKEAKQETGINNISRCCRGITRKAGGCIWKYVENE